MFVYYTFLKRGAFIFFLFISDPFKPKGGESRQARVSLIFQLLYSHLHEGHNVLTASRLTSPPQGGRTEQEPLASKSLPACVFVFLKIFLSRRCPLQKQLRIYLVASSYWRLLDIA